MVLLILTILVIYVTMVYGPIAAWLVELFPTRIRYTSMSLPYHIGNGWFGGFLPTIAFAMVAATGNIYYGLWYPIVIAADDLRDRQLFLPRNQGRRHPRLTKHHRKKKKPAIRRAFFVGSLVRWRKSHHRTCPSPITAMGRCRLSQHILR